MERKLCTFKKKGTFRRHLVLLINTQSFQMPYMCCKTNIGHTSLQLSVLSVSAWPASAAPSLNATKHRVGTSSRDTHPHKFWLKCCQANLRQVTILLRSLGPPLPLHPQTALHYYASWIEPEARPSRARPGQPCLAVCDPAQTWLTQAKPPSPPSAPFLSTTPTR